MNLTGPANRREERLGALGCLTTSPPSVPAEPTLRYC
jgi:hypothetical protein